MKGFIGVIAVIASLCGGVASAQNMKVLRFTDQSTGKSFTTAVAEGGQSFVGRTDGPSYVFVPEDGAVRVYQPSPAGIDLGKKGQQIPGSELVAIESARVSQGVARLAKPGFTVEVADRAQAEVKTEQLRVMEAQEAKQLASGKPVTFVTTVKP